MLAPISEGGAEAGALISPAAPGCTAFAKGSSLRRSCIQQRVKIAGDANQRYYVYAALKNDKGPYDVCAEIGVCTPLPPRDVSGGYGDVGADLKRAVNCGLASETVRCSLNPYCASMREHCSEACTACVWLVRSWPQFDTEYCAPEDPKAAAGGEAGGSAPASAPKFAAVDARLGAASGSAATASSSSSSSSSSLSSPPAAVDAPLVVDGGMDALREAGLSAVDMAMALDMDTGMAAGDGTGARGANVVSAPASAAKAADLSQAAAKSQPRLRAMQQPTGVSTGTSTSASPVAAAAAAATSGNTGADTSPSLGLGMGMGMGVDSDAAGGIDTTMPLALAMLETQTATGTLTGAGTGAGVVGGSSGSASTRTVAHAATLPTFTLTMSAWRGSAPQPIVPRGKGSPHLKAASLEAVAALKPRAEERTSQCMSLWWTVASSPESWFVLTVEDTRLMFAWDPLTACRCLNECPYNSIDSLAVEDACGGLVAPFAQEVMARRMLAEAAGIAHEKRFNATKAHMLAQAEREAKAAGQEWDPLSHAAPVEPIGYRLDDADPASRI